MQSRAREDWCNAGWKRAAAGLTLTAALLAFPRCALAQADATVPARDYDVAMLAFHAGEYGTALAGFQAVAAGGVRTTDGRWIDSICYFAMVGECNYQLGKPAEALTQYEAALKLYLVHSNWMLSVEFPPTLSPLSAGPPTRITWGATSRTTALAQYPDRLLSFQGRIDNTGVVRGGGVIKPAEFYPVRAHEVARCTALALRRRRELMGPACPISPLTTQLVAALEPRPAPPNHWSQAWVNTQLGLAYASAGKNTLAVAALNNSLLAAGKFDHLLTSTSLLELGKLALIERKYKEAAALFLEATYSAAMHGQFDVMEEAFRWGLTTHLVTAGKGPYAPLANAANWARNEGPPPLEASLLLLAAENYAALGEAGTASTALGAAQRLIARREMALAQLGARLLFNTAQVEYLQGKVAPGDASLAAALKLKRGSSNRLFQVSLVDRLFTSGTLSPRLASDLYDEVLREPLAGDWVIDPFDSLAVVTTPNIAALEHWFTHELLDRKNNAKALEIADRVRRRRFFASLPDGGRLLALRWILAAPAEALSDAAVIQRTDLLAKYPALRELSAASDAALKALAGLPLAPEKDAQRAEQVKQFKLLAAAATAQEGILRAVSVQRQPSEFVFPPLRETSRIQESLGERQLALVFFATSREMFGFAVSSKKIEMWRVQDPAKARESTVELLKSLGLRDRNQPLNKAQLADASWRTHASLLLEQLTGDRTGKVWEPFDEVVIVPDGFLWYVPFETLLTPTTKGNLPLLTRLSIRYAPTLGLAVPDRRGRKKTPSTAIFAGKLFPRDGDEVTLAASEQIAAVAPGASRLPAVLPAPSGLFAAACDRVVVLDDIDEQAAGPYDWSPLQIDRGKPGSMLGNWFTLPWGGPEQVLLPGFHTFAENGLRDGGTGEEVFLSLCGLMSTGTRTVLLSRWRTAGRSSHELLRELVQELPHTTASSAWRRSVYLLMHSELDPAAEPRVQLPPLEKPAKLDHPFFWSGYLLVDTGVDPVVSEAPPGAAPVVAPAPVAAPPVTVPPAATPASILAPPASAPAGAISPPAPR